MYTGPLTECTATTTCAAAGNYSPSDAATYYVNATVLYTVPATMANGESTGTQQYAITAASGGIASINSYSMSMIENYMYYGSLSPYGTNSHSHLSRWLTGTPGWSETFYHTSNAVGAADFGTTGGGLNNAILYYYFGHGDEWSNGTTSIIFANSNLQGSSSLFNSTVYKKWGTTQQTPN